MTQDEGIQLAELFRLLGEPNRLRLVVACLDGQKSVGELTEEVGVSQSLVSQHLRLLRAGRLLKQTRQGRNVLYELPDCHIRTMLTSMMDHVLEPEDQANED
jgi:DNA-binding transcriptional ArsR family regulator